MTKIKPSIKLIIVCIVFIIAIIFIACYMHGSRRTVVKVIPPIPQIYIYLLCGMIALMLGVILAIAIAYSKRFNPLITDDSLNQLNFNDTLKVKNYDFHFTELKRDNVFLGLDEEQVEKLVEASIETEERKEEKARMKELEKEERKERIRKNGTPPTIPPTFGNGMGGMGGMF